MRCWLDIRSVEKVIQGAGIENKTLSEIDALNKKGLVDTGKYFDSAQGGEAIANITRVYGEISTQIIDRKTPVSTATSEGKFLSNLDKDVRDLENKLVEFSQRAQLVLKKAELYEKIARFFSQSKQADVGEPEKEGEVVETVPTETNPLTGNEDRPEWAAYLRSKQSSMTSGVNILAIAYIETDVIQFKEDGKTPFCNPASGACGIMQLKSVAVLDVNQKLGKTYSYSDVKNLPRVNIDAGADYLNLLDSKYISQEISQTREFAIVAAYNIGPTAFNALGIETEDDSLDDAGLPSWIDKLPDNGRSYVLAYKNQRDALNR